jgi:hypothetical protein
VVEDGRVDDSELKLLKQLARLFSVEQEFVERAKAQVFSEIQLQAIADDDLTEHEEEVLRHVQARLGIISETISDELRVLDKFRELRQIREGRLPNLDPGRPLAKDERCHFIGSGRILKSKVLRRFTQDGQKYQVRGFTIN